MGEVVSKLNIVNELETENITRAMGLHKEDLFDYTGLDTSGNIYENKWNPYLSEEELEDAERLGRYSRGIMLVLGDPGSGKGLFATMLSSKLKYYLANKKVLMDYRPREAFGAYIPFNEDVLKGELAKMAGVASNEIPSDIAHKVENEGRVKNLKKLTEDWFKSTDAQLLLCDSIMVLDEFKRYFHNRRPHNPMGILLGHIISWWRHMNLLMIGMAPQRKELDRFSLFPYVNFEARCSWMATVSDTTLVSIFTTKYVGATGVLTKKGKTKRMRVNGRTPRDFLGGLGYYDLYNTQDIKSIRLKAEKKPAEDSNATMDM